MTRLVLASRSAARARLLADAGVEVEVRPADVDEAALKLRALAEGRDALGVAETLAAAKALAEPGAAGDTVIGSDQTLELDGRLFDKPATITEAREHLLTMRGREHRLHAAVAVARDGAVAWASVQTATLHVRAFTDAFLDRYLETEGEALLHCVGGYRLERLGAQLFDRIEGDYFTVLGLPLSPLLGFLRRDGWLPE